MFPHGFSALFPLGVSHGNSSPLRRTRRGLQAETQRLFRWTDLGRWSMYAGSIGGRPHVVFRHWNDGNIWEYMGIGFGKSSRAVWFNSYVMLFSGH